MRQVALGRFDDEVIMIIHHTVCLIAPVAEAHHGRHDVQQGIAVRVVLVDALPGIATAGDVVESPWLCNAQRSSRRTIISSAIYFKT